MNRYDPTRSPDATEWLELDEQERTLLVEEHHRRAHIEPPNATIHATIHVIVENQLALDDEPVVRALRRLTKQGLSRHDAIHAIGSVLAERIFEVLKTPGTREPMGPRYYAAVERLTAKGWRKGYGG